MRTSVQTDQRGLGHLVMIVIAVVVIAGVGLVGWRVTQKDKDDSTKTSTTELSKAASDACLKVYDDKDLCKFTGNYNIDKLAYKMTLTSTTAEGSSTSTFLSDGKGNTQMTMTASGQVNDAISLNGVSYLKDAGDGRWFKYAADTAGAPPVETNPTGDIKFETDTEADTTDKTTYKKIGKEACGKLTCLKYQIIDPAQKDSTQFIWFDTKDFRMQRFSAKDASSSTEMVISYQSVKITAPSPTKDFPTAGDSLDAATLQQYQDAMANYPTE